MVVVVVKPASLRPRQHVQRGRPPRRWGAERIARVGDDPLAHQPVAPPADDGADADRKQLAEGDRPALEGVALDEVPAAVASSAGTPQAAAASPPRRPSRRRWCAPARSGRRRRACCPHRRGPPAPGRGGAPDDRRGCRAPLRRRARTATSPPGTPRSRRRPPTARSSVPMPGMAAADPTAAPLAITAAR